MAPRIAKSSNLDYAVHPDSFQLEHLVGITDCSERQDDCDQDFLHREAGKKHDLMMDRHIVYRAIYPFLGKGVIDIKPPCHFVSSCLVS